MVSITLQAAARARTGGAKKVTAAHLKQVVEAEPQFDFLEEIIRKVPDAQQAAAGAPKKDDDSDAAAAAEAAPKKRRGRKKKGDDDD